MFAISERVSPCRARCSARSVGRVTSSLPSSWTTSIARFLRSSRLPRGPFTRTTSGSTVTVTVEGTGMGFLPMRDMRGYQTSATTSPPTPAARASWPVMTPCEVDRIVVPMPPRTFGMCFEST